ncbi:MAG TPA: TlpA disulfide reductase family protein [Edaphocola sp.]|nr:TlpA disulfide reductase family protein [Edaphocola sp.]
MKKIIALIFATFFALQVNAQIETLPNTSIKDMNGSSIAFNEIITPGKVTIVSFWATWCIPCKKEIKNIKTKLAKWQEETPDFNYVAVSTDDARNMAQVRNYAKVQGWSFPSYQDVNSDMMRSLNFQNVPFTIIIDKKGNIVERHTSYEEGNEDLLYEKVKELAK